MQSKEAPQMEFDIGKGNSFAIMTQAATSPEQEQRVQGLISFSDIERMIYRHIEKVPPRNTFDVSAVIGAGIDWFLVPANFIYRYRDDYCFDPDRFYTEWNLQTVFSRFYPTGFGFDEYLELFKNHRKRFIQSDPLKPANFALERRNIKRAMIPLWEEIAKKFKIDSLEVQEIMENAKGVVLPSGRTASAETVGQIGQRIVRERFDALVDDDKDYTYIAKPRCLLSFEVDGITFQVQVEPDYIKRKREKRKSTIKRQVVAKRIVGDFKDSDRHNLTDYTTAFGKTMLVYNFLLRQIGQRFVEKVTWVKLPNGQRRRVFIIRDRVSKPVPSDRVETALEFLQEESGDIFTLMPRLSEKEEAMARNLLEQALQISRQVRI
ncbi:MAG: hypothetical protein A2958_00675 [Candidatus Levybacteria bacterium RIFCSPLOWO2_01_FULL_38_13]|nr:MAG: hypothetical protein A2629_00570 [Candidatus Levybacteria bacterium RIFCSPHIGHO2_01_FULL_41_15]OGH34801.1 MAG: hypothetical protein A2958_00675 [Candidatus Levybacteria bacterium RIFCSPLOWO2_01_FULL_38_13]